MGVFLNSAESTLNLLERKTSFWNTQMRSEDS